MNLKNGISKLYDKKSNKFLFEKHEVYSYIESIRQSANPKIFEYRASIKVRDITTVIHFPAVLSGKDIDAEIFKQFKLVVRNIATDGMISPAVRVGVCEKCNKTLTLATKDDIDEFKCKKCSTQISAVKWVKQQASKRVSYVDKIEEDILIIAVSNDFRESDLNDYLRCRLLSASEVVVLAANSELKKILKDVEISWLPNIRNKEQLLRYYNGERVSGYITIM